MIFDVHIIHFILGKIKMQGPKFLPQTLLSPIGNLHKFRYDQVNQHQVEVHLTADQIVHRLFSFRSDHTKPGQNYVVFKVHQREPKKPIQHEGFQQYYFKDNVEVQEIRCPTQLLYLYKYPLPKSQVPTQKEPHDHHHPEHRHDHPHDHYHNGKGEYKDFIMVNYPEAYVNDKEYPKSANAWDRTIRLEHFKHTRGDLHLRVYPNNKFIYSIDLVGLKHKKFDFKPNQSKQ